MACLLNGAGLGALVRVVERLGLDLTVRVCREDEVDCLSSKYSSLSLSCSTGSAFVLRDLRALGLGDAVEVMGGAARVRFREALDDYEAGL